MVRCVGVADARPEIIQRFTERATASGALVVTAPGVAVACDPAASPPVGVARIDDGSLLVLDGEVFPVEAPDAMAARLLDALRRDALDGCPFEGALTWWDAPQGRVVVRADPLGAAPLSIGRAGTTAVWSSDVHDLLAAGVAAEPDPDAFALLAAIGWVPPPISYLRDADAVPTGHVASIVPGSPPTIRPAFLHTAAPPTTGDEDAQADAVGAALTAAIGRRAGAATLGMFLSAGIDSTALLTVLRRVLDVRVETFTFRYDDYEGENNEDVFAAETARLLDAPHTTIVVTPNELRDRFTELVHAYGAPISFGIHSFHQSPIRDAGIDVMLTGADPGTWYGADPTGSISSLLWRLPPRARIAAQRLTAHTRWLPKGDAAYWASVFANRSIKSEYLPHDVCRALVGSAADRAALRLTAALGNVARAHRAEEPVHRAAFVKSSMLTYVPEWNTRWSRVFGHPIRAPLYDAELVRAIDRRRPWDREKAPLRRFVARHLPEERAYAPKIFQEMPLGRWLRGPLRDLLHDGLSRERVERTNVLSYEPVRRLVDEHIDGIDHRWPLWQLLSGVEWALQLHEPRTTLL